MTESSLSPEEFSKQVLKNLIGTKFGIKRFSDLLQLACLEKNLLQISNYESAEFFLHREQIKPLHNPKIDRLSLVYPPSYEFSIDYQICGHFKVKYNSASSPLPVQVKQFIVNYSGILIPHDDNFEIKNEKIKIKER